MKNRMILAALGAATLLFPLSGLAQQQGGQGQRAGFGREATETQNGEGTYSGTGLENLPALHE